MSHGQIQIDAAGISEADYGYRKAWLKETYTKKRPIDIQRTMLYTEALRLMVFDCKRRRSGTLQTIFRDANGEVVYEFAHQYIYQVHWSEVAPETVGEAMLERICE